MLLKTLAHGTVIANLLQTKNNFRMANYEYGFVNTNKLKGIDSFFQDYTPTF